MKRLRNLNIKIQFKLGRNRTKMAERFGMSRQSIYNIAKSKYVHPQTHQDRRERPLTRIRGILSKVWTFIYGGDAS